MGHTLVTSFDGASRDKLRSLIPDGENKIPFGRKCDRAAANAVLGYHMTVAHWAKEEDALYLPRVEKIRFRPFGLTVTGSEAVFAEEGSTLLYFDVAPGENYPESINSISETMGLCEPFFPHITVSVSTDREHIHALKCAIDRQCTYPFALTVTGLDLFHLCRPLTLAGHVAADMPESSSTGAMHEINVLPEER